VRRSPRRVTLLSQVDWELLFLDQLLDLLDQLGLLWDRRVTPIKWCPHGILLSKEVLSSKVSDLFRKSRAWAHIASPGSPVFTCFHFAAALTLRIGGGHQP
jgi:hypothetical protein